MAEPDLPVWARDLLATARVGHLATASADAVPHVIPVCYALLGAALYIAIDEKPKSGRRLLRLRNIAATGQAAFVVDHYAEDWTQLAWVLGRGPARTINADDPAHAAAVSALRDRYPQYQAMAIDTAEMIELTPNGWSAWRGS